MKIYISFDHKIIYFKTMKTISKTNLDVIVGRLALAVERGERVLIGSELDSFIN